MQRVNIRLACGMGHFANRLGDNIAHPMHASEVEVYILLSTPAPGRLHGAPPAGGPYLPLGAESPNTLLQSMGPLTKRRCKVAISWALPATKYS
jgi:hypothetical protein